MWKLIYELTIVKKGKEDPFEGRNNGEEEESDKEEKTKKEKADTNVEEAQNQDEMVIAEEQQTE